MLGICYSDWPSSDLFNTVSVWLFWESGWLGNEQVDLTTRCFFSLISFLTTDITDHKINIFCLDSMIISKWTWRTEHLKAGWSGIDVWKRQKNKTRLSHPFLSNLASNYSSVFCQVSLIKTNQYQDFFLFPKLPPLISMHCIYYMTSLDVSRYYSYLSLLSLLHPQFSKLETHTVTNVHLTIENS